jgi:hypothetical protein
MGRSLDDPRNYNVVYLQTRFMSALGQKQTCAVHQPMSALPPNADMGSALAYVCFVPTATAKADIKLSEMK